MTDSAEHLTDIGTITCANVRTLWFAIGADTPQALGEEPIEPRWVYDPDKRTDATCPEDRCGDLFRIPYFCDETDGDRWWLFAITDSHFPTRFLVRGDSFEDAYANFLDSAPATNHLKIEAETMSDYMDGDDFRGTYNDSGIALDTDSVAGGELYLIRIDLA